MNIYNHNQNQAQNQQPNQKEVLQSISASIPQAQQVTYLEDIVANLNTDLLVLTDKLQATKYQNTQLVEKIDTMEQLVQAVQLKYDDSKHEVDQLKTRYEAKIQEYINNIRTQSASVGEQSADSMYLCTQVQSILKNIKAMKLDSVAVNELIGTVDYNKLLDFLDIRKFKITDIKLLSSMKLLTSNDKNNIIIDQTLQQSDDKTDDSDDKQNNNDKLNYGRDTMELNSRQMNNKENDLNNKSSNSFERMNFSSQAIRSINNAEINLNLNMNLNQMNGTQKSEFENQQTPEDTVEFKNDNIQFDKITNELNELNELNEHYINESIIEKMSNSPTNPSNPTDPKPTTFFNHQNSQTHCNLNMSNNTILEEAQTLESHTNTTNKSNLNGSISYKTDSGFITEVKPQGSPNSQSVPKNSTNNKDSTSNKISHHHSLVPLQSMNTENENEENITSIQNQKDDNSNKKQEEFERSDMNTDEFSDIFISKQKTDRLISAREEIINNNKQDMSMKLNISKVIEEEESKLRQSLNNSIIYHNPLKLEDLDKSIKHFKETIQKMSQENKQMQPRNQLNDIVAINNNNIRINKRQGLMTERVNQDKQGREMRKDHNINGQNGKEIPNAKDQYYTGEIIDRNRKNQRFHQVQNKRNDENDENRKSQNTNSIISNDKSKLDLKLSVLDSPYYDRLNSSKSIPSLNQNFIDKYHRGKLTDRNYSNNLNGIKLYEKINRFNIQTNDIKLIHQKNVRARNLSEEIEDTNKKFYDTQQKARSYEDKIYFMNNVKAKPDGQYENNNTVVISRNNTQNPSVLFASEKNNNCNNEFRSRFDILNEAKERKYEFLNMENSQFQASKFDQRIKKIDSEINKMMSRQEIGNQSKNQNKHVRFKDNIKNVKCN